MLNKLDMLAPEERTARVSDFTRRLRYKGPVFEISALTHEGCEQLVKAVYAQVNAQQAKEQSAPQMDPRFTTESAD